MKPATAQISLASAWAAWVSALEAKGIAVKSVLRPGASEAQIAAVEAVIGARLPQDARDLYMLADGQADIFRMEQIPHGLIVSPLFGDFEFNALERLRMEWLSWQEIRSQTSEEDLEDFDRHVEVRHGQGVKKLYTHALWVPFATDGSGNSLAFDLDPLPGGTRGQIIVIGSDEDERRVLAPSLTAFIVNITQLLALERLTIDASNDDDGIVFFRIEPGMLQ